MNNNSDIVGAVIDSGGTSWAAIWTGAEWNVLDGIPPTSSASAINDNGLIVGTYMDEDGAMHPFMYDTEFHDLTANHWDEYTLLWGVPKVAVDNHDAIFIFTYFPSEWAIWTEADGVQFVGDAMNQYDMEVKLINLAIVNDGLWTRTDDSLNWDINDNGIYIEAAPLIATDTNTSGTYNISAPGVYRDPSLYTGYASYFRFCSFVRINDSNQILIGSTNWEFYCPYPELADQIYILTPTDSPSADTTLPEVDNFVPSFSLVDGFPAFSVDVTDASDIDWDTARVYVDGQFVPSAHSGDQLICAFDHDLPWGEWHTFEVFVCDTEGNEVGAVFWFPIGDPYDTTPPVIDLMTPIGLTRTDTPLISARVSDDSWIYWLLCEAYIDYQPVPVWLDTTFGQTGYVHFLTDDLVPFSKGEHTVELYAYDYAYSYVASGNWAYEIWSFNVSTSTTVSNWTPTGYVTSLPTEITATAANNLGDVEWELIPLYVDYESVEFTHDGGDVTSSEISPTEGQHSVQFGGIEWSFIVDTQEPVFTNVIPADDSTIYTVCPLIFVELEDATSGINANSLSVTFPDTSVLTLPYFGTASSGFTYFYAGDLQSGANLLSLYVEDFAGNPATLEFTLYYDAPVGLTVTLDGNFDDLPQTWTATIVDSNNDPVDPAYCTFLWYGCPGTGILEEFTIPAGAPTGDFILSVDVIYGMATGHADVAILLVPPFAGGGDETGRAGAKGSVESTKHKVQAKDDGNGTTAYFTLLLSDVAFTGPTLKPLYDDDTSNGVQQYGAQYGSADGTPQWKDNTSPPDGDNTDSVAGQKPPDFAFPLCFVAGTKIRIPKERLIFKIPENITSINKITKIRATGSLQGLNNSISVNDIAFGNKNAEVVENLGIVRNTDDFDEVDLGIAAHKVIKGTLTITYDFTIIEKNPNNNNAVEPVEHLGYKTSTHPIYSTWAAPVTAGEALTLYHTVVDIACRNANGMTGDEIAIVEKIFDDFRTRGLKRKSTNGYNSEDDGYMYYYKSRLPKGATAAPPQMYKLPNLLSNSGKAYEGEGTCEAWSTLFRDCIKAVGISGARRVAVETKAPYTGILVLNWETYAAPNGGTGLRSLQGIAGQGGGANPPLLTPQVKIFENHALVEYGGQYYDPSYGTGSYFKDAPGQETLEWQRTVLFGVSRKDTKELDKNNSPGVNSTWESRTRIKAGTEQD